MMMREEKKKKIKKDDEIIRLRSLLSRAYIKKIFLLSINLKKKGFKKKRENKRI